MKIYEIKQKKSTTLSVTGTTGDLRVVIDGTDYDETFDTDLDTTAANFVVTHAAGILAANDVVVTNPANADLLFVSNSAGRIFTISVADIAGDMGGTFADAKAGLNLEAYTSGIADGGNVTIMEVKNYGDTQPVNADFSTEDNVADSGIVGQMEVLRRDVKHETELVTYATDNDITLVRKEVDGSSPSTLRAEA